MTSSFRLVFNNTVAVGAVMMFPHASCATQECLLQGVMRAGVRCPPRSIWYRTADTPQLVILHIRDAESVHNNRGECLRRGSRTQ